MNIKLQIDIIQCVVVLIGYFILLTTGGPIVRHFVGRPSLESSNEKSKNILSKSRYDVGAVIGKCENLLVITLILADAVTALALIFTAKSIVRSEDIKRDPKYYLGGTLINFSYSVLMGFLIRFALRSIGHPI